MLRRALEDIVPEVTTEDGETILMKGPLSEIFTQALDVAYAKENPDENASLESQQMDVAIMSKLSNAISNSPSPTTNLQTVYGVSKDAISEDTVVDVTTELANAPDESDFVLIIDAVGNGRNSTEPTERMIDLAEAMECLVECHGGKVFTSLKDYVNSRK
jgi:hypothetical protein